jgi:hypothetical protein
VLGVASGFAAAACAGMPHELANDEMANSSIKTLKRSVNVAGNLR